MDDFDPFATQADVHPTVVGDLILDGFDEPVEIGRGGFGVVYRCMETALDRTVAIKVLSGVDEENRNRFVREQQAMGRLSGHPNIVTIYHASSTPHGQPYIVMEYHRHGSLEEIIRRDGPLGWEKALGVGINIARALGRAHQAGILHRDVKPSNILLTDYGEPQLTDFGIARIHGGFQTGTGVVLGSPAFTAPEVFTGRAPTVQSDLYSLAATLFCLITGHAAFQRRDGEKLVAQFLRVTSEPVPDLRQTGIPAPVCSVIERGMSEEVARRQESAEAFEQDLRTALRRTSTGSPDLVPTDAEITQRGHPDLARGTDEHAGPPSVTPPRFSTKYRPRTQPRAPVQRRRLIEALHAGGDRRLALIHAPAGFGKSTLAAQWRDLLTNSGAPVAWLSVDNDDNNVVWFLAHLLEAIARIRPSLARDLPQVLQEQGEQAALYVLSTLVDEIHDTGEVITVVIDDWHRVSDTATISTMAALLDSDCHHLRFTVTSRTQAGLPLSRLRVRDELVEIDSTALRFDLPEAKSFLADQGGLALTAADVADLRESTDGWVAALQLVSLSLRGHADPTTLIGQLSGRHHAIGEYLAENVLTSLEPDLLNFLLATSVTERISGGLASALTGSSHGQARLEEIENRDLFLRRLDEDGEWFRYHHLFAEFLRRRLERDQPDMVGELHRRASHWFGEHHLLSEAVDHALASDDPDLAVTWVERDGMRLVEQSQMTTLIGLIDKLPSHQAIAHPVLQIALAWSHVLLHHPAPSALRALDRAEALLSLPARADEDTTALSIEASLIRAVVELFADRSDTLSERISDCLERPETVRPFVVSGAANVASFEAIYRFDFAAARRWQEWATPYNQQTSGPFSVLYGYCFAGIAAREQLDITAAERYFRMALRLAKQSGGGQSYATRVAGAILGDLLYEQGHEYDAEELLDASHSLRSEGGIADFMLATYGTGSRIKALRGDLGAAYQLLDEGAEIADMLTLPRLSARIRNERIRLALAIPAVLDEHPRWAQTVPRDSAGPASRTSGIDLITWELHEDSDIRLLLHAASPTDRESSEAACRRSQALVERISRQARPKALLRARLLHTTCLFAAGRTSEAKEFVVPAVALCADRELPRVVLDAGSAVAEVVASLETDLRLGRWQRGWERVPSSFLTQLVDDSGSSDAGDPPVSTT
ncbi:serine/threonine-protein kinase [Rhodococcus opacus]|uniref:serine/threonine-protein kinase n=1 Tax=Rhodococcus opacus TaxID=37919 RepID=UPI002473AC9A|nr:serine/threonine-protein kinase [Rhodococcus opacus]MDH6287043.1 ATP/maltotriose-dependent transcriptional regulator MalT [Rhodococcus opacus]